jgi:hypothetical protein
VHTRQPGREVDENAAASPQLEDLASNLDIERASPRAAFASEWDPERLPAKVPLRAESASACRKLAAVYCLSKIDAGYRREPNTRRRSPIACCSIHYDAVKR